MVLAIASGKGGTGKTTVAASLARVAAEHSPGRVRLLDCDVEAPNAELFLDPVLTEMRETGLPVPHVNTSLCNACGRCVEVCAFGAIGLIESEILFQPELCVGCGSCTRHCGLGAIHEELLTLGDLRSGKVGSMIFGQGRLRPGRSHAASVIRELKTWRGCVDAEELCIVEAPPGADESMLEAVRGADYAILIAEPTPLGLHNLMRTVGAVREGLRLPCGVIINRSRGRDEEIEDYCREEGIPILMRIPFLRRIAVAVAEGQAIEEAYPEIQPAWRELLSELEGLVSEGVP